ncbi:MAG: hypothetical protein RIB46_05155 [Pseudomonadales bacterium]
MSNDATLTLTGDISIANTIRVSWRGGVIRGANSNHSLMVSNSSDIMFNNVVMDQMFGVFTGFASSSRVAFINSTIRSFQYASFSQGQSGHTFSDFIIANCDLEGGYPSGAESTIRWQNMTRGILVDNRVWNGGKHTFRVHINSDLIYARGNQFENTGFMSDNHPSNGGVRQADRLWLVENVWYHRSNSGIQVASPDSNQLGPINLTASNNRYFTDNPGQFVLVSGGSPGANWVLSDSGNGGVIEGPGSTQPPEFDGGATH